MATEQCKPPSKSNVILATTLISFAVDTAMSVYMSRKLGRKELVIGAAMTGVEYVAAHLVTSLLNITKPESLMLATLATGLAVDTVSAAIQEGQLRVRELMLGVVSVLIEWILTRFVFKTLGWCTEDAA